MSRVSMNGLEMAGAVAAPTVAGGFGYFAIRSANEAAGLNQVADQIASGALDTAHSSITVGPAVYTNMESSLAVLEAVNKAASTSEGTAISLGMFALGGIIATGIFLHKPIVRVAQKARNALDFSIPAWSIKL